jgi:hypothetical protein
VILNVFCCKMVNAIFLNMLVNECVEVKKLNTVLCLTLKYNSWQK